MGYSAICKDVPGIVITCAQWMQACNETGQVDNLVPIDHERLAQIKSGNKALITDDGKNLQKTQPPPKREVEVVLAIRRPFGCSPIGPVQWMAFQSYDLIIETVEEKVPNRDHLDCGHATMRRLRLELKNLKAREAAKQQGAGAQVLPGVAVEPKQDDELQRKEARKAARSRTRHIYEQLIAPYRACHWHIWLCPIGPYIVSENVTDSLTNIPYAVCWADIVYLFHSVNYWQRFCDVYHTIMEYMKEGINILINPDDSWMTYMRYVHVFSSLYIHIQVLEKFNARIGGYWECENGPLQTLRKVQKDLHREWEMDSVEIGILAEQFSVENIRELSHCTVGRGLNQLLGNRRRSLL